MSNWAKNLASAFIHNPAEYIFIGQRSGTTCACGHIINTAFVVKHPTGHELDLGCDCIENYMYLGHIKQQMDQFLAKKKAEEKKQREDVLFSQFEDKLAEYKALREEIFNKIGLNSRYIRVSRDLYIHLYYPNRHWNKLKRVKNKITSIDAYLIKLKDLASKEGLLRYSEQAAS